MGVEFLGEFLGTLVLVLLGNGIVAGNLLSKTKSNGIKKTKLLGTTGRTATVLPLVTGKIFRLWHLGHWYCIAVPHL